MNTLAYYILILRADFQKYCLKELKQWGISRGLLFFVIYIGNHPGCLLKEIAQILQVDVGYTTRAIRQLSELGLVVRKSNAQDKRQKSLYLTEKGTVAFEKIFRLFQEWDERVTKGWTEQEREACKDKMQSMIIKTEE